MNIEYHLTITAPRNKRNKAIAAQRRYGGRWEPLADAWVYAEYPHACAAQWGDVVEVDADTFYETGDYDFDYGAHRG